MTDIRVILLSCLGLLALCAQPQATADDEQSAARPIPRPRARTAFVTAHESESRPAEPFRLFPTDAYPAVERRKYQIDDECRSCFVFRQDGIVQTTVTPHAGSHLVFAVGAIRDEDSTQREPASVRVCAVTDDRGEEVLSDWPRTGGWTESKQWHSVRIDLSKYVGTATSLRFRVKVPEGWNACLLAEPRFQVPRSSDRPNVILYMIETLRRDHLSLYGYERPTSPFLEELANESVVFTNAWSHSSWTKPSVASYMTGLPPDRHGAITGLDRLGDSFVLLPEMLRREGYVAGGFCASPVVSETCFNYDQGFDVFVDEHTRTGKRVVADALQWLKGEEPSPFFMWTFTYDPHAPYGAPGHYRDYFTEAYDGPLTEAEPFSRPGLRRALWRSGGASPRDLAYVKARYDGEIRYSDAVLEDFVGELKRRGLWDNTIFVVCSDHGEEFYEHYDWDHGRDLFPEKLRVPLLVKLPGGRWPGRRVDGLVSAMDLLPTLMGLVGAALPEPLPGRDLLSGGAPETTGRTHHLAAYWRPYYSRQLGQTLTHISGAHYSIVQDGFQYIWRQDKMPPPLAEVSVGGETMWALDRAGKIWVYSGVTARQPSGTRCEHVIGRLERVSTGPDGSLWGVNDRDSLFVRRGTGPHNPGGDVWEQVPGQYRAVSIADGQLWAVNVQGHLLLRTGISEKKPLGTGWQRVGEGYRAVTACTDRVWALTERGTVRCFNCRGDSISVPDDGPGGVGPIRRLDAGPGNVVWAVSDDGRVLVRTGIGPDEPAGTDWEPVEGKVLSLAVGRGGVWAVDESGELILRSGVSARNPAGDAWRVVGRTTAATEQLYNLEADPMARRNVASRHPETLSEMARLVRSRRLGPGITIAVNGDGRRRSVEGTVQTRGRIAGVKKLRTEPGDVCTTSDNGQVLRFALTVGSDDDLLHIQTEPAGATVEIRIESPDGRREEILLGPGRLPYPGGEVRIGAAPGRADADFGHAVKYATGTEGGVFIWRRLPAVQRDTAPISPEEETLQQLKDLGYL